MIITCNNITKSFGADCILEDVSFHIEEKQKMAIVGVNGAGKTTLFRIITGEMSADSGEVYLSKDVVVGYFSQSIDIDSQKTIQAELLSVFDDLIQMEEELRDIEMKMASSKDAALSALMERYDKLLHLFESKNGYEYKSRIRGVIKGLGFSEEDGQKRVNTLSGGQKTRVALGRLLLLSPDLLLLDEPTNHLDIESIQWLEEFLKNYAGSVIIISHDRYFINRIVTKVVEIENKKAKMYNGNYTFYANQKEIDREIQLKNFISSEREVKRQKEVIQKLRSFNREKSIKRAESREKLLDKMEKVEKPDNLPDNIKVMFAPRTESGFDVLTVKGLKKAYGDKVLFDQLSFDIKKQDKVALIGPNGAGKTTLLRIILDTVKADKGSVALGANVKVGYYDQEHQNIDETKTIFEEIAEAYPTLTNLQIRNALASFVFTGDDVFKSISALSGGEKGRVSLVKIMLSNANFLILDEPTNHLDIYSKEILERALVHYTGTCLFISHDRYFLNSVAGRIIELAESGVKRYEGNYDYYLEKKAEDKLQGEQESKATTEPRSANKEEWQKQKEEQADIRKKQALLERLEAQIAVAEARVAVIDQTVTREDVCRDAVALKELYDEKMALDETLLGLYEQWEAASC